MMDNHQGGKSQGEPGDWDLGGGEGSQDTDQWRQNLTGLDSTDLVFILQGVGDQELEEIVNKIYIPLFDNGDHESTESSVELTGDYLEKRVSVIKKVEVIQYRENDQEPEIDWEVYSSE